MASSSPKRPRPSPSLATRSAASAKAIFTHELTRGVYQSLKEDVVRMEAYTAAIERACPGKRVLDIGTGPEALLAIVAARAGATAVIAVEVSDAAAAETADGGSERRKRTWVNCGAVCVALHVSVVLIREYE